MFQSIAPNFDQVAPQLEPFPSPEQNVLSGKPVTGTLRLGDPVSVAKTNSQETKVPVLSIADFGTPLEKAEPQTKKVLEPSSEFAAPTFVEPKSPSLDYFASPSETSEDVPVAESAPLEAIGDSIEVLQSPFLKAEELSLETPTETSVDERLPVIEEESHNSFLDDFFQSPNIVNEEEVIAEPRAYAEPFTEAPPIEPEETFVAVEPIVEEESLRSDPFAIANSSARAEGPFSIENTQDAPVENPFGFLFEEPEAEVAAEVEPTFSSEDIFPEQVQKPAPVEAAITTWEPPVSDERKKSSRLGGFFRQ